MNPERVEARALRIAARHLPDVARVRRILPGGSCNATFAVVSGRRRHVLRVNTDRDRREFAKEAWCMERAAEVGLPVATCVGFGADGPCNWMLQSYLGDARGLERPDRLGVWRFLGRAARRLHRVRVSGFGDVLRDDGAFAGRWEDFVPDNLRALDADPLSGTLPPPAVAALRARFEAVGRIPPRIGLCHGDLHPRNVVYDGDAPHLVDWGCAHAHLVPHFDMRELLREHPAAGPEARAFASGYGLGRRGEGVLRQAEGFLLLCSFDLLRWARDRAPDRIEAKRRDLLDLMRRIEPGVIGAAGGG